MTINAREANFVSPFKSLPRTAIRGEMREGFVIPYNKNLVELAKDLRNNMTKAEKCLWTRIKSKSLGYAFFRQRPIGEYIADFYCPKAFLVVEVDGERHLMKDVIENDSVRDEYMHSLGLTVFRFSNIEVLENTDKTVEKIYKFLDNKSKPGSIA